MGGRSVAIERHTITFEFLHESNYVSILLLATLLEEHSESTFLRASILGRSLYQNRKGCLVHAPWPAVVPLKITCYVSRTMGDAGDSHHGKTNQKMLKLR